MSLNTIVAVLSAASLLISIGTALWSWLSKGNAAVAAALERVVNKQIEHDRRIQKVEDQLPHMPTAREVAELVTEMRGVTERLSSISQDVHRQGESIRRIEDVMLEGGR